MSLGRMSGLARLLDCPGHLSLVSPEQPSFKRDYAAAWGHLIHSAKEGQPLPGCPQLFTEPEEQAAFTEAWDAAVEQARPHFDELRSYYVGWEHEVAVFYDVETYTAYPTDQLGLPGILTGHADGLLVDTEDNSVHVNDLKTGSDTTPLDAPQLMGYLLAAFRLAQLSGQVTRDARLVLSVLHFPREGPILQAYLEETGSPMRWYARDVPLTELREFARALKALLPAAKAGILNPGDHCVFCPSFARCPVWDSQERKS